MSGSQQLRRSAALVAAAIGFAGGCRRHYEAPDLSAYQLGTVSLDKRAELLSVDGLPPPSSEKKPHTASYGAPEQPTRFLVGPGCRELTAKYEESFFIWGKKRAERKGIGGSLWTILSETETHTYTTLKPIRFFVPVRAGYTYWVTATFTGEQFLPRVVEIEPSGESSAKFLPDLPCGKSATEARTYVPPIK
jgi:hypothetical protein